MRPTAPLALLALLLALAPAARAASWRRPVTGPVARAFAYGPDPFRRGWHRGVDLAAAPGSVVRAACTGTVVAARAVAWAGGVVTLRCGRWRVTHLPLVRISVRPGAVVAAGAPLGRLGLSRAHAGLHLGVRLASDRFGYVDPMHFLGGAAHRLPPVAIITGRSADLGPAPAPAANAPAPARGAAPHRAAATTPDRAAAAAAHGAAVPARVRALAPWPAWAGLGLLLAGAVGGGVRLGRRRARAAARLVVSEGVA